MKSTNYKFKNVNFNRGEVKCNFKADLLENTKLRVLKNSSRRASNFKIEKIQSIRKLKIRSLADQLVAKIENWRLQI